MQIRSKKRGKQLHLPVVNANLRGEQGWSLAATIVMMLVITMFVGSMWSSLLPAYKHVQGLRYRDVARSIDEGITDTVLAELNTHTLVPPGNPGSSTSTTSTSKSGAASFDVITTTTNLGTGGPADVTHGPPTNCVLYSATRPASDQFCSINTTVTHGVMTKQLTVLMSPIPTQTISPFIYGPAFGTTCVYQVGLAGINGYNLPNKPDPVTGLPTNQPWDNPYQFADTTVAKGVTWQIGSNGNTARSQVIAGSQYEFWQPGTPPSLPSGTSSCTYEPFTQIMGNVYTNYPAQNGVNGNGYWMRNQLSDIPSGANVPGGSTDNANVFGAANGMTLSGIGVPSGYESGNTGKSIPIPGPNPLWTPPTLPAAPNANSGNTNPNWGWDSVADPPASPGKNSFAANMPISGSPDGGNAFKTMPYTGGYITSPGPGMVGANDTWNFPSPPTPQAPGAPIGVPAAASGGLGVPNKTGTYFSSSPLAVTINGGTLRITNSANTVPASLSATGSSQTINIPPGNYALQSLQVTNGGKIIIDADIAGQTQFFITPAGTGSTTPGQGTTGAVFVDNKSSINMTGITPTTGFKTGGTTGFGKALPSDQIAVDNLGSNKITESSGSSLNLVINTNSNCNMLFGGNTRALVNAPSSNINVGYQKDNQGYTSNGNGANFNNTDMTNDANFYGSIVGGNVSVVSSYTSGAGAYLHYDVKLKMVDSKQGAPTTFNKPIGWYDPWAFKTLPPGSPPAGQWRAVSWVEQ